MTSGLVMPKITDGWDLYDKEWMAGADRKGQDSYTVFYGERNGQSKLTDAEVEQVRQLARDVPQHQIASQFGVSQAQVSRIIHGKQRAKGSTTRTFFPKG